jgi:hypothetical protein
MKVRYKFKMEYLKKIYYRYHVATKKQKKHILDEFCETCGYNRKYAIRLLNDIPPEDRKAHPLWLPWARKHLPLTPEIEKKLLSISSSTIDRRLKNRKYYIKKRIYSSTRPQVFLGIDLVAHLIICIIMSC